MLDTEPASLESIRRAYASAAEGFRSARVLLTLVDRQLAALRARPWDSPLQAALDDFAHAHEMARRDLVQLEQGCAEALAAAERLTEALPPAAARDSVELIEQLAAFARRWIASIEDVRSFWAEVAANR